MVNFNQKLVNNKTYLDTIEYDPNKQLVYIIECKIVGALGINFNKSMERVTEKIINRSPHVFGNEIANTAEEALNLWNKKKKKEYSSEL